MSTGVTADGPAFAQYNAQPCLRRRLSIAKHPVMRAARQAPVSMASKMHGARPRRTYCAHAIYFCSPFVSSFFFSVFFFGGFKLLVSSAFVSSLRISTCDLTFSALYHTGGNDKRDAPDFVTVTKLTASAGSDHKLRAERTCDRE